MFYKLLFALCCNNLWSLQRPFLDRNIIDLVLSIAQFFFFVPNDGSVLIGIDIADCYRTP